jgi:hypothetical protein
MMNNSADNENNVVTMVKKVGAKLALGWSEHRVLDLILT